MLNLENLRVARARKNISQTDLARKVGITQSHYNRIEHGKRDGSIKTLRAICKVLGVGIEKLLEEPPAGA